MAIKFKPEQQDVIDTQNKNQLVSASAGSGKTTIMIQKIINLITLDKIDIKKILVLTYTKASAEEMKQKLVSAINEKVKTDKSLISQIDEVALADISTIHSFFQKVIKKYFMVLGIDPSFEIIDETSGIKLKQQAFLNAVKIFEQTNDNQFLNLLKIYGDSRNLDTIKALVFELNTFLLSVTNPQDWCKNVSTLFYESLDKNLAVEILNKEVFEVAQHFLKNFQHLRQLAVNFDEPKFVENLNKIIGTLELVKSDKEFFVQNCNAWCSFPSTQFRAKEETEELAARIKSVKASMKDYSDKIKAWGFDDKAKLENSLVEMKPVVNALCELTLMFQEEYSKIKTEKNLFDYDDLEKCMLRLIEIPEIKNELTNHYEKIFVDEYQDANRIQEKIISAICKSNNRFMVGDVKQSIYGFRQAEPDIFLETMHNFEGDKTKSAVGYLNYNFRSHNKILNFVNIVFEKIMTVQTSKIDYTASSIFKWDEGTYKPVYNQEFLPQVEIDIIKRKEKEEKVAPTKLYSVLDEETEKEQLSDAQLEALFIAKKIDSLLGKKIWVAKKNMEKQIEYRDITILLRSRGSYLDEFCAIITSLGIPLYANTNKSLFEDSDTQLLLNIAKLANNPHDDIALVSVMHSVFASDEKFTFDDLAKIRLSGNPRDDFWKCVDSFDGDQKIVEKIKTLWQTIQRFAFEFENLGAFKAYNNIINKHHFVEDVLAKEDGIQKYEKVKKYVSNFLSNGFNFDLRGFLEFVENNVDEIKTPDYMGGENCVSITTIHASKGLEYPIVIMGNTNQNFDKNPRTSAIKLNQKCGLGMKYFDLGNHVVQTSLPFEAIKKVNKDDDFAEKLRLLYVALTRPQNHLIIVGIQKQDFDACQNEYDIKRQNSYLKLLIGALKPSEIEKINAGENVVTNEYCVNVTKEENFSYEKPKFEKRYSVDEKCVKIFRDYFDFENKNLQVVKASSSVTELRQKFGGKFVENLEIDEDNDLLQNRAEIGTVYHKILELIDFDSAQKCEDVERFVQENEFCKGYEISSEKIFDAIKLIKTFGVTKYLKEQKFAMKFDLSEFDKTLPKTEIMVNGIIDLICCTNNGENILIDYKFTENTNKNEIIATYKPQIELYKKACEFAGLNKMDRCFLLLINTGELIEIK